MTGAVLQNLVGQRLGETLGAAASNRYYTDAEALSRLDAAQRLFVLLTLCLETSGTFILQPQTAIYQVQTQFADWLLPLRIRVGGKKVRPARFAELRALDGQWSKTRGDHPTRYAVRGFDLIGFWPSPIDNTPAAQVTYARSPIAIGSGSPEIPEEYHSCLVDGAIVLMRCKEGGQEFQKVLPLWDRFMGEAQRLGELVKARNREQGYDYLPFELARFDRSRLVNA